MNSAGDIFVVENGAFKVRRVDSVSGTIETVAGTGRAGYSGDGGLASRADINPTAIAVDQRGNLYISDTEHNRIRRIDVQGDHLNGSRERLTASQDRDRITRTLG